MKKLFGIALMLGTFGLFAGCASEDSVTAPIQNLQGTIPLQIENGDTGEFTVIENAITESSTKEEIDAIAAKTSSELGWNLNVPVNNATVRRRKPPGGSCGSYRKCGPYVNGGCNGSSGSCGCTVVCG